MAYLRDYAAEKSMSESRQKSNTPNETRATSEQVNEQRLVGLARTNLLLICSKQPNGQC